jgi:hypothetical protein
VARRDRRAIASLPSLPHHTPPPSRKVKCCVDQLNSPSKASFGDGPELSVAHRPNPVADDPEIDVEEADAHCLR